MPRVKKGQANRLLGYPEDARRLILNADDFGMCNSTNEAIMRTLAEGVIRSTTVMVPCPWSPQALLFLAGHPEVPFGIHLTVISDPSGYRWGPLNYRFDKNEIGLIPVIFSLINGFSQVTKNFKHD